MEVPPLVIDLAVPARALSFLIDNIKEDLRTVFETAERLGSIVGVPILSEHEFKHLVSELEYFDLKKSVAIVELHAGLRVFPPDISQIDSEGDDIGGVCPTRGSYYLTNFLSEVTKIFRGTVLDLTDFYGLSLRRGLFSCSCSECEKQYVKELERIILEEYSRELNSLGLRPPSPEEVLDNVFSGSLRTLVQSPSEQPSLAIQSHVDSTEGYMFERILPTPRYLRVLAGLYKQTQLEEAVHAYLFLRARSRVCARSILEALSPVDAEYKAVSVEGVVLPPISCSAVDFAVDPRSEGIEIWLSGFGVRGVKVRYYNLPRGRYLVGQLDDSLWKLISEIEISERVSRDRVSELMHVFDKLTRALCSSWTPTEPLRKGSYAVCGWPEQAWDLTLKVVDYLMHQGPRIAELHRQKRELEYIRDQLVGI